MKENFIGIVSKLRESTSDPSILDVHIIQPGWGSSGYYPVQTLQNAANSGVYHEGMHMYWDHATEKEEYEKPERSLSVLAGALTSDARYDANGWDGPGLYATAKAFPEFSESIGAMGSHIGVSHNVYGISEWGEAEGREGHIITEISADPFNSVDFVTIPGAGGHYKTVFAEALKRVSETEEEHDHKKEATMPDFTIEDVRKDTKIMEALRADIMKEADSAKLAESLKEAQTKNTELTEALAEAKAKLTVQEGRTYALAKVAESELPALSQKRVIESIAFGEIPESEGNIDTFEFDKAIEAAVKAEGDYIDAIVKEAHGPLVHDLGKKTESNGADAKEMYKESLISAGFDAELAKEMAGI